MKNYKSTVLLIISGAVTGTLQTCVFLPFLMFISLIPLLVMVYKSHTAKEYRKTLLTFLLPYYLTQSMFLLTVSKLMPLPKLVAVPLAVIATMALTVWLTVIMLLPLLFYTKLKRGNALDFVIFSLLFIVGEWLEEYVPFLSFPWSGLWIGVISEPTLIQPESLLGCHFVSLIILLSSSALAYIFCCEKRKEITGCLLICFALVSTTIAFGNSHISSVKQSFAGDKKIKIMIAQDNIEGLDKTKISSKDAVKSYISIMEHNWEDGIDFVLLPETAIPCRYKASSKTFRPLVEFAKEHDTTLLAGCFASQNDKLYNAVYTVTAHGFCQTPYLKQVLVPFGESIPLGSLFNISAVSSAQRGQNKDLLCEDNNQIASIICIESIYPSLVREQMQKGGKVLCIPTNDSWFSSSFAKYAHYRHTIMRAVESGRYTLRAGNCGVSAVITPWGEQKETITKPVKTAIVSDISLIESNTLYTWLGDIIILPGCALIILSIIKLLKKKLIKTPA